MNLHFGYLGNGCVVYDVDRTRGGDYVTVGHIDPCGAYKLYEHVPVAHMARIQNHARAEGLKFREEWQGFTVESRLERCRMSPMETLAITYRTILDMTPDESLDLYVALLCKHDGYTRIPPNL